jgi:hypothetical protein
MTRAALLGISMLLIGACAGAGANTPEIELELIDCGSGRYTFNPDPERYRCRTAADGPADWTVLDKTTYSGGDKRGYYVTIALFGSERETQVSTPCYTNARLGQPLPSECR